MQPGGNGSIHHDHDSGSSAPTPRHPPPVWSGAAGGPIGAGDLIFLKDGFVLEGQVKRESVAEFDKQSGEMLIIPKGFSFYVDDNPRRVYFSHTLVGDTQKRLLAEEIRLINKNTPMILGARSLLTVGGLEAVVQAGDWNEKWERSYRFRSPRGVVPVTQRMGFLTPHFARVDATSRFAWSACYLTRELGPEAVLGLLLNHPELKDKAELKPAERAARRFKLCDFLAQAGWYNQAEVEFNRLAQDIPDQKERVEAAIKALGRIRSREQAEEIKRLHLAGQYENVLARIKEFPAKEADDKVLAQLADLKSECTTFQVKVSQAGRYLDELAQEVGGGRRQAFLDMAAAIKAELSPETLPRLEAFLGQAAQAERLRKEKQQTASAGELLALAVSGWLLGSPSAETNVDRALRLWAARDLVLAYQREPADAPKGQLAVDYLARKDAAVPVDEIVQLIRTLPPPAAEEKIETRVTEMKAGGQGGQGPTYLLKLPPEYRHGRSYPVLVVLHDAEEKPRDMLNRWSQLAADNGYILIAPAWQQGLGGYGYTEGEHNSVLLALRDLRRRFHVDSDRIFLFGLGQGANMAYDVGLSHPDQFAGVMPMSGVPEMFALRYWRNAQYLPFYVVVGDHAGDPNKKTRDYFQTWVLRGFPTLWVQYKGRGMEWFGGEQSNIMDWMRNKKRAFPLHQLGTAGNGGAFGTEFSTMRQSDNRFYWLSTNSVLARCLNSPVKWNNQVPCAMLTAKIDTTSNDIFVRASGVKQLSIAIGRNSRGDNMIDFDKPVTVRIDLAPAWVNRKIVPNLKTMLEDLHRTGDRQRLQLARLDFAFVQGHWRLMDR